MNIHEQIAALQKQLDELKVLAENPVVIDFEPGDILLDSCGGEALLCHDGNSKTWFLVYSDGSCWSSGSLPDLLKESGEDWSKSNFYASFDNR